MIKKIFNRMTGFCLSALLAAGLLPGQALAFGEAGPLQLAQFGNFVVNARLTEDGVTDQMYVEFMIPQQQRYPHPVILVHGGGGQGTDWKSTVDGRDGWANYLVNAGFAVYILDRPGAGRSGSNNTYGNGELRGPSPTGFVTNLATSTNWPNAPMIYDAAGNPDIEAWQAENADNPSIVAWAATGQSVPFASNDISIAAQVALLERIGPAVIFTHSAGGTTAAGSALQAARDDLVIGILAFESGGADPYSNITLERAQWSMGAPDESARSMQAIPTGHCSLQTAPRKSENLTFADVRMAFLYSERLNMDDARNHVACQAMQAREAGLEAIGIYMPDHEGGAGTGHFAMAETVSGELATNILIPALAWLQGEELPAGFTSY